MEPLEAHLAVQPPGLDLLLQMPPLRPFADDPQPEFEGQTGHLVDQDIESLDPVKAADRENGEDRILLR